MGAVFGRGIEEGKERYPYTRSRQNKAISILSNTIESINK